MKKLLTLLLLAASTAVPVGAYTVDELTKVAYIATYQTNPNFNGTSSLANPLIDSHGLTAHKVSDTEIRLNGFMGCLDFVFKLTDANGNETNDGEYLTINASDYAVNVSNRDYAAQQWQMLQSVQSGYSYPLYTYKRTSDYFKLRISGGNGVYTMLSTSPVFIHGSADSGINGYIIRIFDSLELESFEPNATMSDRFYEEYGFTDNGYGITEIYPISSEQIRSYPVRIEMDPETKRFTILNFGNNGYGIRQNPRYYYNLYNTSIPAAPGDGKFVIGGTFDPSNHTLTFDTQQFAKPIWAPLNYYKEDMFNLQLERLDLETNITKDELFGTYEEGDAVHHNDVEEGWVTNDGRRRTYEPGVNMTVETYTYYLNQLLYGRLNFEGGYHDNVINGDLDITADVELKLNETLAHPEQGLYINGEVLVNANDRYIDHCEVYVVKGKYNSIKDAGFTHHIELGHIDGKYFHHKEPSATTTNGLKTPATREKGYQFRQLRSPNELGGMETGVGDYTAFVKTVYTPESNLTPTFHSLQTFTIPITTSVNDLVSEDSSIDVKVVAGGIEVSNTENRVEVVDMTGRVVYSGNAGHIDLPASIYIVRVGSYTQKVVVR